MKTLRDLLINDEGIVLAVYDDATGKPILPGTKVIGHPTIGVGRCLDGLGITIEEAYFLLDNDIKRVTAEVSALFSWFPWLNEARQFVVLSMVFNLGLTRFCKFKKMIAAIQNQDWDRAATEMANSSWAKQVGDRDDELCFMMRYGSFLKPTLVRR